MMSSWARLEILLPLALISVQQTTTGAEAIVPCQLPNEDVNHFDVKLPVQAIPSNLTTYVCHNQRMPIVMENTYHVIGFQPLISSHAVVHHMILFGCPDTPGFHQKPHVCSDADGRCRNFLVQWSKGIQGPICSPPQAGVPLGPRSVLSFSLQIHWNNENGSSNLSDDSGFRVFYTTKRRHYNLGNVQIGQNDLEIPPATASTLQSGSCSTECTKEWLDHPIYLTRAHIHMHYLGNGGSMYLFRPGMEALKIFEDTTYDYTKPPAHYFVEPVKVMPGDEIKVTCYFNSKDGMRKRNQTVYWGEGTDGEMCYAFVTYFPKIQDFDQCIQFATQDVCPRVSHAVIGQCVFPGFIHVFESGMAGEIIKHCTDAQIGTQSQSQLSCTNANEKLCSSQCLKSVREVTEHPCMQGRLEATARRRYLPKVSLWAQVDKVIDLLKSDCCEERV